MPAQISSILDGPAGPPPAIDKPSLRRLAESISALPEFRLAALVELLVKSGITENDATLNLDLESLPIRVFRQVWHCVYDPSASSSSPYGPKHTILVAQLQEDSRHQTSPKRETPLVLLPCATPPLPPPTHPSPNPTSTRAYIILRLYVPYSLIWVVLLRSCPIPFVLRITAFEEDDELQDDDDDGLELGPGPSTVPAKRKAPSSSSSKQKSAHTSSSPPPHTHTHTLAHPHPPQSSGRPAIKCNYTSPIPDFPPCTRTFSRVADMRRHIEHQHTEEEAQATIDGKITKTQATLLGEDWKGTIKKPTCEGWVLTGVWFMLSGQTFSRKDAVKRHQTETGARVVDGVCVSCPGSGNGAGAGKKRARRK
ncbi:hypothetical protein RhiXN_05298 [Rhizoctonia solani]|uniref:C2H2-type domain-containing protein n=1 Tax=Rhizoctonia solani TaxID=456999 RepID=A0A8H8NNZ8_9AGAM|nr:uncharacterized protein RhiXN_05298 [Rhizoctonia solani]QRW17296.1 hypothetical protein RhiXN_05298 [Rhizoctonia solani]